MNEKELESLVTRLLDTKSITAKEAIELLKLVQSKKEVIYSPFYVQVPEYKEGIIYTSSTNQWNNYV